MVDTSYYSDVQRNQSRPMAAELGYEVEDMTDNELFKFGLSFERQFILQFAQREWTADVFERHVAAILMGAMIAKKQMEAQIDGEIPGPGKIGGPLVTRAGFLGIGDDWDDVGNITTGSPQNWMHSGTTLLGGSAGNAIRIGTNAVHVIVAYGSYHASPKIESIQNTLDGRQKPIVITKWAQQTHPTTHHFKVKELDSEIVLKKNSTILSKLFIPASLGASVSDIPYVIGASFIAEAQLRLQDVATLPGTTNDVIMTT